MSKLTAAFLGFLFLLAPASVLAAGISVEPAALELGGAPGAAVRAALTVANPSPDVEVFEVYADDMPDSFAIAPRSFTLESAANKLVQIEFRPPKNSSAKFQTNLSVVGRPLAVSEFRANSGVKIPFTYTPGAQKPSRFGGTPIFYAAAVLYGLVVLILGFLLIHYFRQKRANKTGDQ